ncbi:hypothetical protein BKA62DRAFT_229477 [Auriculariales sp. MPI-PUGE-AT-0066]|nr:hypothetical protein BKA62DRAFT_229477 [Auriculariales sp. MPI-PUGE-AT-0066]
MALQPFGRQSMSPPLSPTVRARLALYAEVERVNNEWADHASTLDSARAAPARRESQLRDILRARASARPSHSTQLAIQLPASLIASAAPLLPPATNEELGLNVKWPDGDVAQPTDPAPAKPAPPSPQSQDPQSHPRQTQGSELRAPLAAPTFFSSTSASYPMLQFSAQSGSSAPTRVVSDPSASIPEASPALNKPTSSVETSNFAGIRFAKQTQAAASSHSVCQSPFGQFAAHTVASTSAAAKAVPKYSTTAVLESVKDTFNGSAFGQNTTTNVRLATVFGAKAKTSAPQPSLAAGSMDFQRNGPRPNLFSGFSNQPASAVPTSQPSFGKASFLAETASGGSMPSSTVRTAAPVQSAFSTSATANALGNGSEPASVFKSVQVWSPVVPRPSTPAREPVTPAHSAPRHQKRPIPPPQTVPAIAPAVSATAPTPAPAPAPAVKQESQSPQIPPLTIAELARRPPILQPVAASLAQRINKPTKAGAPFDSTPQPKEQPATPQVLVPAATSSAAPATPSPTPPTKLSKAAKKALKPERRNAIASSTPEQSKDGTPYSAASGPVVESNGKGKGKAKDQQPAGAQTPSASADLVSLALPPKPAAALTKLSVTPYASPLGSQVPGPSRPPSVSTLGSTLSENQQSDSQFNGSTKLISAATSRYGVDTPGQPDVGSWAASNSYVSKETSKKSGHSQQPASKSISAAVSKSPVPELVDASAIGRSGTAPVIEKEVQPSRTSTTATSSDHLALRPAFEATSSQLALGAVPSTFTRETPEGTKTFVIIPVSGPVARTEADITAHGSSNSYPSLAPLGEFAYAAALRAHSTVEPTVGAGALSLLRAAVPSRSSGPSPALKAMEGSRDKRGIVPRAEDFVATDYSHRRPSESSRKWRNKNRTERADDGSLAPNVVAKPVREPQPVGPFVPHTIRSLHDAAAADVELPPEPGSAMPTMTRVYVRELTPEQTTGQAFVPKFIANQYQPDMYRSWGRRDDGDDDEVDGAALEEGEKQPVVLTQLKKPLEAISSRLPNGHSRSLNSAANPSEKNQDPVFVPVSVKNRPLSTSTQPGSSKTEAPLIEPQTRGTTSAVQRPPAGDPMSKLENQLGVMAQSVPSRGGSCAPSFNPHKSSSSRDMPPMVNGVPMHSLPISAENAKARAIGAFILMLLQLLCEVFVGGPCAVLAILFSCHLFCTPCPDAHGVFRNLQTNGIS